MAPDGKLVQKRGTPFSGLRRFPPLSVATGEPEGKILSLQILQCGMVRHMLTLGYYEPSQTVHSRRAHQFSVVVKSGGL